ncbi:MAG: AmmeMemoRadiSam system protein B [Candidatus Coatesbacteria bacterium]|nr:AmmeMemoRadiSam system protein B [Candidatus Coatesbacteria bacterium]
MNQLSRKTRLFFLLIIILNSSCLSGGKKSEERSLDKNPNKRKYNMEIDDVLAGRWYTANPKDLKEELQKYLDGTDTISFNNEVKIGLVPHAGLIYSGPVAAYTYKAASKRKIDTVIILGFFHRIFYDKIFLLPGGIVKTPLGDIEIDEDISGKISKICSKFAYDSSVLRKLNSEGENSLELNFPFIKHVFPDAKIVPIYYAQNDYQTLIESANAIATILKESNKEILLIVSSDLSHFNNSKVADSLDNITLEGILSEDPKVWNIKCANSQGACGKDPITVAKLISQLLGYKSLLLKHSHSGKVSGDNSQVVGYGSIIWTGEKLEKKTAEKGAIEVSDELKTRMLSYVRKSINEYVKNGKKIKIDDQEDIWNKNLGLFVTLKKAGNLRGCIGYIEGYQALRNSLVDLSIAASTKDPRFEPINKDEIDSLHIEISILSPIYDVNDVKEIKVGRDGIIIKKGFYQGLLLPQVATEYGWDLETFLEHTCEKAGLSSDSWKDKKTQIKRFSATIFQEKEGGKK